MRALAFGCVLLSACACQHASSGASWPEADALFHQDPRWLGADAAFSVKLGDDRVLWLFGDTFVAKTAANKRSESTMVRNSVALQVGLEPTSASMSFAWKGTLAAPSSYFAEDGNRWYWPGHGVAIGNAVVIFLQRQQSTGSGAFGFEAEGWRVAICDDTRGDPSTWTWRMITPSSPRAGIFVGSAVNVIDQHVVVLAQREPGDHAGFLVRWDTQKLLGDDVDSAEWWTGSSWSATGEPAVVLSNAGPESSLHFDSTRKKWVHVRSEGFGSTTIVVATADHIEGPWSAWSVAFRPPESDQKNLLVYAAKAHPELSAPEGKLAVTYATNDTDFARLVSDSSIYFPRFVAIGF
ncbi:MAG: DUF4185 domain-containing protein [Archangium sp.]